MPLIGKYFHFLILCLLSLIGLVLAANPVPLTNVCYFPEEYPRQAGFRAITAGLASTILQGSVDELLNYSGLSSLTTQQTTTTTPNFQLPTLPLPTNVYGLTVVPLYLLVQLQGYFVPPVSGQYTFSLENTNDAAIIFFGNPSAFPCGDLSAWPQASADDITVTDGTFPSRTLFLKAGVAYPMRISYYNSLGLRKFGSFVHRSRRNQTHELERIHLEIQLMFHMHIHSATSWHHNLLLWMAS